MVLMTSIGNMASGIYAVRKTLHDVMRDSDVKREHPSQMQSVGWSISLFERIVDVRGAQR